MTRSNTLNANMQRVGKLAQERWPAYTNSDALAMALRMLEEAFETCYAAGATTSNTYQIHRKIVDKILRELEDHKPPLNSPEWKEALAKELRGTLVTILGFAYSMGFDLQEELDKELHLIKQRKWSIKPDGTAQHIEE